MNSIENPKKMASEKISFTNKHGEQLAARLELPVDKHPHTYALFAHCFTCNKNLTAVRNISRALNQNGIAVVRFDFTGLGESEGDFENTNFSSNIEDLIEAALFMEREMKAPQLIIGHSLGGAATIFAAHQLPFIKAVATIGAPSDPSHVQHLFGEQINTIQSSGVAAVTIGGRPFTIKKQFLEDIEAKNMAKTIKALRKPLLILHSPQDTTVGINNAAELYQNAHHPKSFVSLDGADHLLSNKNDSDYAGNVIANWALRYLEIPEEQSISTAYQVAVRTKTNGYTTEIKSGKHHWVADEPESVGGNNFGPSPYELLLSSLGACTSMTLRMYADRKNWDLQEVEVHLNHEKVHENDCNNCDQPNAKIDQITRSIQLKGDLDEKQKQRLLEIANKCPVHKTLHNKIEVVTRLKE